MLNIIFQKLSTNIFSGISIVFNFILLISINSIYGISLDTDIYFFSVVLVTFISIVSQLIWEGITNYYINFESKIGFKSSYLYSSLLNLNIVFSTLIIFLYFLIVKYTNLIPSIYIEFFNIFIFYVLLQNIYTYNKFVLNIKKRYDLFYTLDIFVILFNIISLYLFSEIGIIILAYSIIISTTIVLIYQFILIFYKYNIKYFLIFYVKSFKNVYVNSFNLKLGQVLYLSKDLFISAYIQNININGLYSLYTYAFKLVSLSFQVIQIPAFNRYITEISLLIKKKERIVDTKLFINKKIFKTLILVLVFQVIIYLFLPELLKLISYQITINQINETRQIFVFLALSNLIYLVISFLERYISFLGQYKKILFISLVFFILILVSFFMLESTKIENIIIVLIVLPSVAYLLLVALLYLKIIKEKR